MTDALDEARLAHAAMPLPTGVMGRPDAAWLARLVLAADDTWRAAGKPAGDDPIVQSHWLSWEDGQALMKRNNELLAEVERLRAPMPAQVTKEMQEAALVAYRKSPSAAWIVPTIEAALAAAPKSAPAAEPVTVTVEDATRVMKVWQNYPGSTIESMAAALRDFVARKGMRQADTGWTAHVGPPAVKDMEELAVVLREQRQREKDVAALVEAVKRALSYGGGMPGRSELTAALAPFPEPAKPGAEQTAPADRSHETGLFGGPPGFCNRAGRWCPTGCAPDRPACGSQGDSPQDVINRLAALEAAELERGERERNVAKAWETLRRAATSADHPERRPADAVLYDTCRALAALAQAVRG